MVVYEITIDLDSSIYEDFLLWNQGQMVELIALPGFKKAVVYTEKDTPYRLSVQYHLKNMDALEHYATHHVPKLRAEAEKRYPGLFKAKKRIMKKESVMEVEA